MENKIEIIEFHKTKNKNQELKLQLILSAISGVASDCSGSRSYPIAKNAVTVPESILIQILPLT